MTDELTPQGRAIQQSSIRAGEAIARWTRLDDAGPDALPPGPATRAPLHSPVGCTTR